MTSGVSDDAWIGAVISGGFGTGWALWAASGLSGAPAAAVRVGGVVLGVLIVVAALVRRAVQGRQESASTPPAGPHSGETGRPHRRGEAGTTVFRSRGYWVWIAIEVVAIVVGNAVLGATGHTAYIAAWTAAVVGIHFLGFGRLFAVRFYVLGALFLVAAAAGAIAGGTGASSHGVEATTGLIAAAGLFAAGAWIVAAPPPDSAQPPAR